MIDLRVPHADWSRRLGPIALIALIAGVVVLQQFGRSFREHRVSAPTDRMLHSQEVRDPGIAPLTLESKVAVRLARIGDGASEIDPEAANSAAEALAELDKTAETPSDRLRVAIVGGELVGKDEALRRLHAVAEQVEPGSPLAVDVHWFTTIYKAKERPDVPSVVRAALRDRHGWFMDLALVNGLPDQDPARRPIVGGGRRLVALAVVQGLGAIIMGLAAVVLLIATVMSVRAGEWQCEFETTELPGWVYLEMFNISIGWFTLLLAIQIVTLFLTGPASVAGLAIGEVMLWFMPLCLHWPRLRGLDWDEVKSDLGLHVGAGMGTEIKAGLIGFMASLPLVFLVEWVSRTIESSAAGERVPGGYSPLESPLSHSWIPLILGCFGAVCWAPLTEEILFRGALYRSIRTRLGRWGAIPITAVLFGAIHPYSTAGLVSVASAGMVFGLLREWRGSLVAPMTAHFLHNGVLMSLQLMYVLAVD